MRANALRNKESYNLTAQPDDPPIHADFSKGVVKNLREQSPFREGTRNKDWVNPTLASNVLFYNHGNETASNHHIQTKKVNKKGYNMNHYVAYDIDYKAPQKAVVAAQAEPSDRNVSTDGRRNQGLSSSQNIAEAGRANQLERSRSPITSEQRIGVERSRSPVDAKSGVRVQARAQVQERVVEMGESRAARPASPIQQEQRSSSRIERAYDRSQRSGSATNLHNPAALNKSASQQNIKSVQNSAQEIAVVQHKDEQKQGMTRSHSAVSMPGQYGEYLKATQSNISNPDNLICDYCVNQSLHNVKVQNANAYRRQEMDHAALIQDDLKRQLEDERRRHYEKLKTYQEQIDAQKVDQEQRLMKNRALEDEENKKIRNMLNENTQQDWARAQKQMEQKQRYINELGDQLARNYEARQQKYFQDEENERKNKNLLINDAEKEMQRRAMNEQYKRNIKSQLEDQMREKEGRKDLDKAENDAYRKRVQEMITKDIEARKNMDRAKKEAFLGEVDRHLAMRDQIKGWEKEAKAIELDNLAKKLAIDRQMEADKAQAKRAQRSQYIKTLGDQIADKEAERQAAAAMQKQAMNATLMIPQKQDRCYNCAKCRNMYPIKLLNKQRRLGKV